MTLVIVHYTYFLYLVFTSKPENNVVIGLHEPAGPCDELQPVTTPFGHVSIAEFLGAEFQNLALPGPDVTKLFSCST